MNVDLMPFAIAGVVLMLVVLAMAVWRKVVSTHEDDTIHVLDGGAMLQNQVAVAKRLAVIDKWGKLLTILTVLYALGVAAVYFYQTWMRSSSTTGM